MSIPPVRESFLENIGREFEHLRPRTLPPIEFDLYRVVATPKPGEGDRALSPEQLVCLEMTCYESGSIKVTAVSNPDEPGQWYPPTSFNNSPPPPGAGKINPWPNVPLDAAWNEIEGRDLGTLIESVTLAQAGGVREPTIPMYTFVLSGGRVHSIPAFALLE